MPSSLLLALATSSISPVVPMPSVSGTVPPGPLSPSETPFCAALANYTRQTGTDLTKNPVTAKISTCCTPNSILDILQDQALVFDEFRNGDSKLVTSLRSIVGGVHALSTNQALGGSASLLTFSGIGVLLTVAKDANASYDALLDLLECVESILRGLTVHTEVLLTLAMTDMVTKIMIELLSVLALATKQINEGRFKSYAKQFLKENDFKIVLQRLERLTPEEAQATARQILEVIYGLFNSMTVVMEGDKASIEGTIRQALVSIQQTVNEVAAMNRDQLQFEQEARYWLSPPDPSINHNVARKTHHSGTAAWFTEGKIFKEWQSDGSLLWINGKPGSGKSVLCSTIIKNAQHMREAGLATVGYFYIDFRDPAKHGARGLLASLLIQLCVQSDGFCKILSSLYSDHDHGLQQPSDDALARCLKDMLELSGQSPFYIIIDGVDECPNSHGLPSPREQVLKVVKELIDLNLPHLHICIASRPEIDIRVALAPLAAYCVSLHDENGQNEDIAEYIKSVVYSDATMREWPEDDKVLVISTLTQNGGGMFRWATCQLATLRRCPSQSIRRALKELPKTLDETYERILQNIDEEKWEYAYRIFQFLAVSARPLRVEELAEVFAIQVDMETTGVLDYNARWRPANAEAAVLSACSSLITIVDVYGDQVVQYSHFSVREFLIGNRLASSQHISRYHVLPRPSHTFLAKACLSVLLHLSTRIHKKSVKKMFPLATYAAEHWVDHARLGDISFLIHDMEGLFDRNKPYFAAWIWAYDINAPLGPQLVQTHPETPEATPLYYAALCGFLDLAERLIDNHPQDIDTRGGDGATPLHAALRKGHSEIALFLLQHSADAKAQDNRCQTPLHIAALQGNIDAMVIQSLIDCGADPNAKDEDNETPLYLSSSNGRLEATRLLLKHGANANHQGPRGRTPLHAASINGHHHVAQLLLDNGANANAQENYLQTSLHLASDQGALAVARVLLENVADTDVQDVSGWTALHVASSGGQVEAARLLLDKGADVNTLEKDGWTALHLAVYNGHHQIVALLLNHGADPRARNNEGDAPYEVASEGVHAAEAARVLLRHIGN